MVSRGPNRGDGLRTGTGMFDAIFVRVGLDSTKTVRPSVSFLAMAGNASSSYAEVALGFWNLAERAIKRLLGERWRDHGSEQHSHALMCYIEALCQGPCEIESAIAVKGPGNH